MCVQVGYLASFTDDIPDTVLAMLPTAVAEAVSLDEYGVRRHRVVTMFGVFEHYPGTLFGLRRAGPKVLEWRAFHPQALGLTEGELHLDAHNVLHRDVKMDNVLVAEDGRLVVCDLGEALQLVRGPLTLAVRWCDAG